MALKIAAFCLDIDGTLMQSEHLQYLSWAQVLKPLGVRLGRKEYATYCGQTGKLDAAQICQRHKLAISPKKLLARKEKLIHSWLSRKKPHLMPGARKLLRLLAQTRLPIAAVTGAPRRELMLKLGKAGIMHFFSVLVGNEDTKRSKPHPAPYLAACRQLGIKPHQTLVFEDTSYGVESATRAGLIAIAIPNTYAKGQDFSRADFACKDLHQACKVARHLLSKK